MSFRGKNLIYESENKTYSQSTDIVICCTGYNIGIPFMNLTSIPTLYKRCVDPTNMTIGYIGFSPSFNWVQLSDLQARWFISTIINGNNKPSYYEIQKKIQQDIEENKKMPFEYYDLAYFAYDYCDDLAKDMNIIPKSKATLKSWVSVPQYDEWT